MGSDILYAYSVLKPWAYAVYHISLGVKPVAGDFDYLLLLILFSLFIALFGGIILFAVAMDWLDVGVFYLFMGQCGDFFFLLTFPIVISYISALFLSGLLHILPWHGENMLFLLMFHSGEMCCSVTACSH